MLKVWYTLRSGRLYEVSVTQTGRSLTLSVALRNDTKDLSHYGHLFPRDDWSTEIKLFRICASARRSCQISINIMHHGLVSVETAAQYKTWWTKDVCTRAIPQCTKFACHDPKNAVFKHGGWMTMPCALWLVQRLPCRNIDKLQVDLFPESQACSFW